MVVLPYPPLDSKLQQPIYENLFSFCNPLKHFWMKYGIYNLGTKIIPIKPKIFSNSQPHRPKPNPLW